MRLALILSLFAAPAAASDADLAEQVRAALNPDADPCTDFYEYACGGWMKSVELPADKPRWTRSFSVIHEGNQEALRGMLQGAADEIGAYRMGSESPTIEEKEEPPEVTMKVGLYYGACMDEASIEAQGASPLGPYLEFIAGIEDAASLMTFLGQNTFVDALFGAGVDSDFKEPGVNILHMGQGGLGLPDRDYYLVEDENKAAIRGAYLEHVATMFTLLGDDAETATAGAQTVFDLEKRLAEVSLSRVQMRDPNLIYNKIDRAGLAETSDAIPWDAFFDGTGYGDVTAINVMSPDYFTGMAALIEEADYEAIRTYLRWRLVDSTADDLSAAFVDEHFAFFGKTLQGQSENEVRWKRCAGETDAALGELLGQLFVEQEFPGDSKAVALEMIHRVEEAFDAGLPNLEWMDDQTRERASEKLAAITNKIGYPDEWRDYSDLQVGGHYFENVVASAAFDFAYEWDQIGEPVDPNTWYMSPPTVNAYYNPLQNEIVFPAGILQPPFFKSDYPTAMNYGAMGMVMGHEITHGFDDEGRKFAGTGELKEWWEPQVAERFEAEAACVGDQYSSYELFPGEHIDGDLTMGENIADLGGLKLAFRAYAAWAADNGKEAKVAGFTPEQLIFLSYAQAWCTVATDEFLRLRLQTDAHSPARYRVNGAVTATPEFGKAFKCKRGSEMRPKKPCEVW